MSEKEGWEVGGSAVGGSWKGSWRSLLAAEDTVPPYPSSHADCVGEANAPSVSSRGTRVTSGYMPKSFHSLNVKGVYLEEWLHVANAHVPAQPGESGMRRLGDSAAPEVGELIVIVDSVVECQRRSPWVTWGQFPLFPVGDPPPLSQVVTRIVARYAARDVEEASGRAAQDESNDVSHIAAHPVSDVAQSHDAPTTDYVYVTDESLIDLVLSSAVKGEAQTPGALAHEKQAPQPQNVSRREPAEPSAQADPKAGSEAAVGQDGGKQRAAIGGDQGGDLGWAAVLHWAENIMGASHSPSGQAGAQVDASGAAGRAYTGDRSDLALDMQRLLPHADGVWVVDDGLEYDERRPTIVGVPGGLVKAPPGLSDAALSSVSEGERERQELQEDEATAEDDASAASHENSGRNERNGGWIYGSGFPLGPWIHGGPDTLMPAGGAWSQPEPLHFVRWRRWLRRRRFRTVERRLVRVEASLMPGNRVGDVDMRSVPPSSLAICNLSTHRLYVGIYMPLDSGSNVMVLREGEVLGLGINAVCRALNVKGNKCILVAARRSNTLPPLLTRDATVGQCVVVAESLFKRVYLSVVDGPEQSAASNMACAAGEDGVVALNALQREIYLKAKPDILHRLQLQARSASDERWEQDAFVRAAGLSEAEHEFVRHRRRKVHANLQSLIGVELDSDQVPCVCLCMGGGGVRAMIFALGALRALSRMGVLGVVTYSAALSGSAWMQTLWMSMLGRVEESLDDLVAWLSVVLQQHPVAQAVASTLSASGGGEGASDGLPVAAQQAKGTLHRLQQQRASAQAFAAAIRNWTAWSGKSASLVNIYGFLAANAWMPVDSSPRGSDADDDGATHKARHTDDDLDDLLRRLESGLSSQAKLLTLYDRPLPIYTAVRVKEVGEEAVHGSKQEAPGAQEQDDVVEDLSLVEYQWYEWTPFDFYSADSGQSIPVWALGRQFEQGTSVSVCPEMPVSILFGVWGAAFTANASEVLRSITGLGVLQQQQLHSGTHSGTLDSSAASTGQVCVNTNTTSPAANLSNSATATHHTHNSKHVERFQWVVDTINFARALETPLLKGVSHDAEATKSGEGKPRKGASPHSRLAAEFQKFRFVEPFECADPFVTAPMHPQSSANWPPTPAAAVDVPGGESNEQWERADSPACDPPHSAPHRQSGFSSAGAGNSEQTGSNMTMLLTDAGVHINAPFPAVLRPQRRADVIICFDARSLAGRNDKDESFDVLRPAASFAADKRWPFPSLDAQRMKGVGIRPCSVFGADSRAENACVAGSPPLGPHARPATPPALVSSGSHRCSRQATPDTGGEDARLDTVQTHTCSPHEEGKPQETKRSVLPETPGVGRGHSEADDSQAPILVYLPLVKNEAVDGDLDPIDTSWCDLFEFTYQEQHFRRLLKLSEANVEKSKDSILSALACAVCRKKAQKASEKMSNA